MSPLLKDPPLRIRQESTGTIGFKIYPGALLLANFLENDSSQQQNGQQNPLCALAKETALKSGSVIVELGAGVCGLPSLIIGSMSDSEKQKCIATDVPVMLPLLSSNVQVAGLGDKVEVAPLTWGMQQNVKDLVTSFASAGRGPPSLLIGADIVYHEPLIDPLLACLKELTEASTWGSFSPASNESPPFQPPLILLSYVQRFKRAKAFFKKAKKWFDIETLPAGQVVDYDALTWHSQWLMEEAAESSSQSLSSSAGCPLPRVDSSSANYERYLRAVCAAADRKRESASSSSADGASDSVQTGAPSAVVYHAVDSDSQSDDPGKEPGLSLFAGMAPAGLGDDEDAEEGIRGVAAGAAHDLRQLRSSAQAAARFLGLPQLAEALDAYIYVLRRKG